MIFKVDHTKAFTQISWQAIYATLITVAILVFSNTLTNGYNYDDTLVTQNQIVTSSASWSSINDIFTSSYYKDDMGYSFGYRPMVLLSFMLEHSIFSESPFTSHLINLILYTTSVLLFFNFLRKLFGDDKINLAFLASLLFLIHPIHSEAVASIKNRDEILAFLFVIGSGLMAFSYLDKKKWHFLLLSGLFFAAGMLSKKSVFPLSIVLPVGFILFREINKRELFILFATFLAPAAVIASDLVLSKLALLIVVPFIALVLFLIFFKYKNDTLNYTEILYKNILIVTISWLLLAYAIYQDNFGFVFLAFIMLWFSTLENEKNIFQILLQLLFVGYFFKNNDFYLVVFLIASGCSIYSILNKKVDYFNFILVLFSSIGFIYLGNSINKFILIFYTFLFFYISFRNAKISLVLAAINFIVSLLYFEIGLFQIALILFSISININFLKNYFKSYFKNLILLASFLIFLMSSFYLYFSADLSQSPSSVKEINVAVNSNKNEISEGRRLEYMENTLVAPHTFNEKIATGVIVLGEYARLHFFPKRLSFYYGFSEIKTTDFTDYKVWGYAVLYFFLLFLGIYYLNKNVIISFGIGWYFISILLFSNWIELVAGMVGERLAFTASAGFCIFIAAIIYELKPHFNFIRPRRIEGIVLVVLILLSIRTISRNNDWESPIKLMTNDIFHLDNSAQANNMLALSYMNESVTNTSLSNETRFDYQNKAINYFSKAIAIHPYFFNYHFDLGRANVVVQNYTNAKKAFLQAYKLQPDNLLALDELTKRSFDLKQKDDTVYYGNLYLKINPFNEKIQELVAYICLLNKDFESAKKYAERGLSYFPNNENFKHMIIDSSN